LFTVARIKPAAAVIVSTRADEPFFRGVEPERGRSHAVVASRHVRQALRATVRLKPDTTYATYS
jgi:hypothetical protein